MIISFSVCTCFGLWSELDVGSGFVVTNFLGETLMDTSKVAEYAHALFQAHGNKAEAEAAQRAKKHEENGEADEAAQWHAVRAAIRELRGAHES